MSKNDSLNGTTLPLRKIRQRESAVPKHRYRRYQIADIIKFKDFKTYRINDYVKAYFPMSTDILQGFSSGSRNLDGKTGLEDWFNIVAKQTKNYVNESEVPKRRHKTRK